jgi:hypothetical protein
MPKRHYTGDMLNKAGWINHWADTDMTHKVPYIKNTSEKTYNGVIIKRD